MKSFVLLFLVACANTLPTSTVPERPTPWCVRVGLNNNEIGLACTETLRTCERTASAAKQFGPFGGVIRVDTCVYLSAP